MKGLSYLFLTTLKNSLKELKKNPGRLVMVLVFVLLLGVSLFSTLLQPPLEQQAYRPLEELYVMVFALYAITFFVMSLKGLGSGASFYSMADVSLLFQTPVSPRKILFYGLMKQMGMSLLMGGILLFQYGWVSQTYPLEFVQMLLILLGYGVVMFCSQVTAMTIYSLTSGDEGRQRVVKWIAGALILAVLAYVGIPLFSGPENMLDAAVKSANGVWLNLVPVAGWMKAAVVGVFTGTYLYPLLGLVGTALYSFVMIRLILRKKSDYYEDVLQATEVSFSAITAKKEGKVTDVIPKNVKVGKIGIGKGKGAQVFFYKHMVENRRSRVFLLDTISLIFLAVVIVFAFFMKDAGLLSVFMMATYMQVFSTAMGRWGRELTLPFVYLIPVKPFRKLVAICQESILKAAVEAVLMFVLVGVILEASPVEIIACIIARVGFAFLFIAGDILVERVLGGSLSKAVLMVFYFLFVLLLCIPGILLGIFLSGLIPAVPPFAMILLGTFVFNAAAAALIAFLCRDILNCAELNNR